MSKRNMTIEERLGVTIEKLRALIHAGDPTNIQDIMKWLSATAYDRGDRDRGSREWDYFSQAMTEESYNRTIEVMLTHIYDGLFAGRDRGVKPTDYFFYSSDTGGARYKWLEMRVGTYTRGQVGLSDEVLQINQDVYDKAEAKKMAGCVTEAGLELGRQWLYHDKTTRWSPEQSSYAFISIGGVLSPPNLGRSAREALDFAQDNRRRIDDRIKEASRAADYINHCWGNQDIDDDRLAPFRLWANETYMIFLLRAFLNIPQAKDWPQLIKYDSKAKTRSLAEKIYQSMEIL